MSDFIKKLKGLELPDELLEAVSGGVMTAEERECLEYYRARIAEMSEEDREAFRLPYIQAWDEASDEEKAMLYENEYALCLLEVCMGRSLR